MPSSMVAPWVEPWLSADRFATYVEAAAGDARRALRLYEWNACASAALLHDLGHLEIGLRNAIDRALRRGGAVPWTDACSPLFAPLLQSRSGTPTDLNERFRAQLAEARAMAARGCTRAPAHGDIVSRLGFGFWRYLVSRSHEKALWVPLLHRAFPRGTDRGRDVEAPLVRLNAVRNRVAHHEPLLRVDLNARVADVLALARLLDPDLARYVRAMSTVAGHVSRRP
jgi:hypothetical protein